MQLVYPALIIVILVLSQIYRVVLPVQLIIILVGMERKDIASPQVVQFLIVIYAIAIIQSVYNVKYKYF